MVASVVAVIAFRSSGTTGVRVATPSSTNGPTTIPPSVEATTGVADWTWVSAVQGWSLVRTRCGATVCMSLHATSNGGRTWTTVRTPELVDTSAQHNVGVTCATHLCVSGCAVCDHAGRMVASVRRFCRRRTGVGGWRPTARSGGRRCRGVARCRGATHVDGRANGTDGCTYHIQREPLGARSWQPVSTPVFGTPSLIILGSDVYLVSVPNLASAGHAELRRSTDAGKTWTEMIDPCTVGARDHITISASAAPDGVFVVLCSARQQPTSPSVRISTDGGVTFGPRRPVPLADVGVVRAASAQTLAVGYSTANANGVLVSDDHGMTWRAALHPPLTASEVVTLGWEDSTTARVSFNTNTIWTTRDAGLAWTANQVTP